MSSDILPLRILVVIPAYNEQKSVTGVIAEVKNSLPGVDILVVNDGSLDRTHFAALNAGANVVSHVFNLGYGSALETGYFYALKNNYDLILQMDGDGQHIASELHKLLEPFQNNEADIVIGNRWCDNYSHSLPRKIGQKLFSIIIYLLSGHKSKDSTSGFQGLGRQALSLFSSGIFPHDYPDADVILMSKYAGLRIKEVPVKMLLRNKGTSMHSGIKPVYYVIKMLLSIFIVRINKRRLRKKLQEITVAEQ